MSMQTGSIDADGLARTSDGKLYVTLSGIAGSTAPAGAAGMTTVLAQSYVAVSCPSDVTEDTLATITVPANILGANGALRISTAWSFTNSANNKTLRIRYSGGSGTQYMAIVATTNSRFTDQRVIANAGATNSQVGVVQATGSPFGGDTGTIPVTSAVDTTAATTIVITGQKALNTETLTLVGYSVEVIKP